MYLAAWPLLDPTSPSKVVHRIYTGKDHDDIDVDGVCKCRPVLIFPLHQYVHCSKEDKVTFIIRHFTSSSSSMQLRLKIVMLVWVCFYIPVILFTLHCRCGPYYLCEMFTVSLLLQWSCEHLSSCLLQLSGVATVNNLHHSMKRLLSG